MADGETKAQILSGTAMELHEIRYFLALSRTLNFTRAAEACNVSQPALTRAIQKLEDELGGLLVSRERNNIHLTELGRLLQPHLAEIAARTHAAKETATRFLRLDCAQLRLGVMCTIGPARFVELCRRFRAANPGVGITLLAASAEQLCDLLTKGELDACILARPDGFVPPLRSQLLYRESFGIACADGHPFSLKKAIRIADLDGQPYLARINCEYSDSLCDICGANGIRLVSSIRCESDAWILAMVAAGLGICLLPEHSYLMPGAISRCILSPSIARKVCLVTVAGRRWSAPLSAFVQTVRRYRWQEDQKTVPVQAAA